MDLQLCASHYLHQRPITVAAYGPKRLYPQRPLSVPMVPTLSPSDSHQATTKPQQVNAPAGVWEHHYLALQHRKKGSLCFANIFYNDGDFHNPLCDRHTSAHGLASM